MRLAGDGYGRYPSGCRFTQGVEVESGCKQIECFDDERLLVGEVRMEEGQE